MAQETNARPFERVHFIGIGGAGMSGIALVLHQRGFHVTGSDLKASKYTRALVKEGIEVFVGHHARTIDEVKPDVVVISTAIPQSNPELVRARELGIEVWHRAKMLSFLSGDAITIACAGTHGKTTTSSLAATMLERMNLKPTFLIGGIIDGYETNGNSGEGPYFVAEADESDGSFLNLDPNVVIVTNIEADHLDHYGSLEAIEKTFVQFMGSVPEDGHVIVCGENPHVPELARSCGRPVLTYGFGEGNDVVCTPKEGEGVNAFSVRLPDGHEYSLHLDHNPGLHNCLNATAVLTLAYVLGLPCDEAPFSLSRGQRQMVALASVVVLDPDVVLLDEPTSGLDYRECMTVMQTVCEMAERGCAVSMVCHDMEVVSDFAERLVVMADGKILAKGDSARVFADAGLMRAAYVRPPQVIELAGELARDVSPEFAGITQVSELVDLTEEMVNRD